jgi:hypothetical protein
MKAMVYVVATYHRWGDELHVFGTEAEAEACVMEYAHEFWDESELGRFPRDYTSLHKAWNDHCLWGSVDSRWELERHEVDLPETPPGTNAR